MKSEFAPIEKSSLPSDLAERIVQMIRSGVYESGDRLLAITEMARSFGVGHPSVREALKQLEVIGVVEIKHGSGVYVRKGKEILLVGNPIYGGLPSKKLMLDLLQARIPIETTSILDIYGSPDKDYEEHEGILEAIRAGEAALARQRMQQHLEGVRQALLRWDPEHTPLA